MPDFAYDLAVIGSGPAGQKAAIAAAKLGKRVAVIDRRDMIGGVCIHTGTIPSKTLREAILYLSGFRQRTFYGHDYTLKTGSRWRTSCRGSRTVLDRETEVVRSQLKRNGVETVSGLARFARSAYPRGRDARWPGSVWPPSTSSSPAARGRRTRGHPARRPAHLRLRPVPRRSTRLPRKP